MLLYNFIYVKDNIVVFSVDNNDILNTKNCLFVPYLSAEFPPNYAEFGNLELLQFGVMFCKVLRKLLDCFLVLKINNG